MTEAEILIVDTHPEEPRSEGPHGSVQEPPPLPSRTPLRATWRAHKRVLMPLVAGGSIFAVAALPLFVVLGLGLLGFDLLGPGNNGLGLGLLAAVGYMLGMTVFVAGEVAVFAVWLLKSVWSRARKKRHAAPRQSRKHDLTEPREVSLDAAGGAQPPALAVPVALERD